MAEDSKESMSTPEVNQPTTSNQVEQLNTSEKPDRWSFTWITDKLGISNLIGLGEKSQTAEDPPQQTPQNSKP